MTCALLPVFTLTLLVLTPAVAHGDPPSATRPSAASPMADGRLPCSTSSDYCHDGFYLRETASLGYATIVSTGSVSPSRSGGTFSVSGAIGGTLAPGFVVGGILGVSLAGAFQSPHLGPFIDWYPTAAGGWHTGLAVEARLLTTSLAGQSLIGVGPSATLFAGYDWWFLRQWSLGLLVSASAGPTETMHHDGGDDSGFRFAPLEFVLGGTALYH